MFKIVKMTLPYFTKYFNRVILFIFLAILSNSIAILQPYISGEFIDNLIMKNDYDFLSGFCLLFALVSLSSLLMGYLKTMIYINISSKSSFQFNKHVLNHIQKSSLNYASENESSKLTQQVNNDTINLISFSLNLIQNMFTNIIYLIIPLIYIYMLNLYIFLFLLISAFCYAISYYKFKGILFSKSYEYNNKQFEFFSKLNDQLVKIKFIKVNGLTMTYINRINNSFTQLLEKAITYTKTGYAFTAIESVISLLLQIAIYVTAGISVVKGNMTVGGLTIVLSYVSIVSNSLRYFFQLGKLVQENLTSYKRISDILNMQCETNGEQILSNINTIELNDLSYAIHNHDLFCNLNYTFEKGLIYIIRGSNGSGKSTLINLVLGLYVDQIKGMITYNNISIKNLDMNWIRRFKASVLLQETELLADSVNNNIYLWEDIDYNGETVSFLMEKFGLESDVDFINKKINDKSSNISGGEKQKISLIRCLAKEADLLILDEPTSALDRQSIEFLVSYLHILKQNRIVIIITHDEEIKKYGDILINLDSVEEI